MEKPLYFMFFSYYFFRCLFTAAWGQRGTLPYTSPAALQWLRFSLIIILFSLGMLKTSDTSEYLEEEKIQAGKETSVRLIVSISLYLLWCGNVIVSRLFLPWANYKLGL